MRLPDLRIVVALLVFVIFSAMVAAAAGYRHEARLVPLVVGIPAMLLAGWQFFRELRVNRSHAPRTGTAPASSWVGSVTRAADGRSSDTEPIVWLLMFTSMVLLAGMVVGGTIGVMACQRIWLRESWRTTAAGGAVAVLVLHVCFERGFQMTLFDGWLVEWMSR